VDHALDELAPESLRELLRLLEATGVEELEVEAAGGRLLLRREPVAAPTRLSAAPGALPAEPLVVTSPAVGVFHRGTEDGAPPLAAEGQVVRRGQVLAIVEVLRMPHPVEASVAGRLERFLVDDGQPAEYGQPLLVLVPSEQESGPAREQGGGSEPSGG
jgi:biotin carboxyl carrier protein